MNDKQITNKNNKKLNPSLWFAHTHHMDFLVEILDTLL